MGENNQTNGSFDRPLIMSLAMFFVTLVTPSAIYLGMHLEISAHTWLISIESNGSLIFTLMLDSIFYWMLWMKYLFVIVVYRFYSHQTTLKRTLLFGVLIEIYFFVAFSLGNILSIIFPTPGIDVYLPYFFSLPNSILIFPILAKLVPRYESVQGTVNDE
ncbi:MAG: hypothetical protein ACTSSE_08205 [Candidatus Thorarchaeota archaeon]